MERRGRLEGKVVRLKGASKSPSFTEGIKEIPYQIIKHDIDF